MTSDDDSLSRNIVLLVLTMPGAPFSIQSCTGVLIHPQIVLTAAHCITNFDGKSRPIENDQVIGVLRANHIDHLDSLKTSDLTFKAVVHSNHLYPNPRYVNPKIGLEANDIGIVYLQSPAPSSLPWADVLQSSNALSRGTPVSSYGYGRTDKDIDEGVTQLRSAVMQIDEMEKPIGQVRILGKNQDSLIPGDSGGPSFIRIGEKNLLWGIHSASCHRYDVPCATDESVAKQTGFIKAAAKHYGIEMP